MTIEDHLKDHLVEHHDADPAIIVETTTTDKKLMSQAIFGSFDGLTSVWGVIIALLGRGSHSILLAAVGLAIAAGVGMGAGEWLGDDKGNIKQATVMMLATVAGTIAPIIPFLFLHGTIALVIAIAITLGMCAVISMERGKGFKGYLQTYGVLVVAGVLTAVFSLLTGSGG